MQAMDVNSLFARAEQAFFAGRADAARADLKTVQRLAAPHPAVLHLLGLVEARCGAPDAAQRAFEAALALAPLDWQIVNNFANFLADRGNIEGALDQYRRVLRAQPNFHDARFNRALLLQRLGRLDEALADLEAMPAGHPPDARVHSARGGVLRALGRLKEAAAAFDAALAVDPQRPVALHGRARVALEAGEETASDRYQAALGLRPADPELQLGLAEALEAEGKPAAVDTLAAAVAARPNWAEGQSALARMRWEAGEGRAFTRDFEAALAAAPEHGSLWLAYVSALGAADLFPEAAEAAARGRAATGDDPRLLLLEALYASEAAQIDRAERLYAALPRNYPGRRIAEVRHRIRQGEYEHASALADRARAEEPWDVGAWAMTGLLWRLSRDSRAEWLLRQPGLIEVRPLDLCQEEVAAAAEALRRLHRTRAHPIGQSLRGGTQTRGALFAREEPEIARLRMAVEAALLSYWDQLPPPDSAHPLLRHRKGRPLIRGSWSVRLTDGGFHVAHFHSAGALSSACYFVVPEGTAPMEGWLELGGAPAELGLPLDPLAQIEPIPGRMALFPSYLFHGTRPFSKGERLTVAFDVVAQ